MLPLAVIERIARKAGAERLSADAIVELRNIIEELALELAIEAAAVARHANRKTIKSEDIKLVAGKIS